MTDTMTLLLTTPHLSRSARSVLENDRAGRTFPGSESASAGRTGIAQPSRAELVVKALIAEFLRPRNLDFF